VLRIGKRTAVAVRMASHGLIALGAVAALGVGFLATSFGRVHTLEYALDWNHLRQVKTFNTVHLSRMFNSFTIRLWKKPHFQAAFISLELLGIP
jgi:hypothetical protein